MKIIIFLLPVTLLISGCAQVNTTQDDNEFRDKVAKEAEQKRKISEEMKRKAKKEEQEYIQKAKDTGCYDHALGVSKQLFSLALKYYGTNPSTVTETPELWAETATRACVDGYDAAKTNQPPALLDQYMYSIGLITNDPFQYRAISNSLYWGYGRAMR
ncbi:hypothetical protein [Pantoea ananatis]|uniref:hypothetical protein n=1 Tax=Pantoea ananas TaxID=553 RepID=UPI001B30F93A|nr:hypothetical protein [Pantoea ananatis]